MSKRVQSDNSASTRFESEKREFSATKIDPAQRFMLHYFPNLAKAQLRRQ